MQSDPSALGAQEHFARHAEPGWPGSVVPIQKFPGLVDGQKLDLEI